MKSSCIAHPQEDTFIIIRKWQLDFCEGNQCAAALLSFFEYWHNYKLSNSVKSRQFNNVAQAHGDPRSQDESLWQWHTEKEIEEAILIYKREAIGKAIKFLASKNVITISNNPNPKYNFDKTRWFLFYPAVINKWLSLYNSENLKTDNRSKENRQSMPEIRQRQPEIRQAISDNSSSTHAEIEEKNIHVLLPQDICVDCSPFDNLAEKESTVKEVCNVIEPPKQPSLFNQQSKGIEKPIETLPSKKRSKAKTFNCPAEYKDVVNRIFEFWKVELNHPTSLLTPERGNAVLARLIQGYTEERIRQGILGCKMSPHNMGQTNGTKYDDLELICRSGSKLEHKIGIYLQNKPKSKPTVEKTNEQKAVLERNQPEGEELQNFASYLQEARTEVKLKKN